jgi:hypothetical protein
MHVVSPLPLWMNVFGMWPHRRSLGPGDLDRLGFYSRQADISRHGRGRGRLQQAWCNPQRKKNQSSKKEHSASLGPANPETHA